MKDGCVDCNLLRPLQRSPKKESYVRKIKDYGRREAIVVRIDCELIFGCQGMINGGFKVEV